MTTKEQYSEFCKTTYVPVFSRVWWLNAVCIDGYWDVLLYKKNGEILGALPYYVREKVGVSYTTIPKFTQSMGVIIKYPKDLKYDKKLSYEKEVSTALIEKLEKLTIVFYQQCFHYSFTNWLPFYWKKFSQSTSYVYLSKNIYNISEDELLKSYSKDKRKNVIKAQKDGYSTSDEVSVEESYAFHKSCLEKIGSKISYSFDIFNSMVESALENKSGKLIKIKDNAGNTVAITFIVWDEKSAYGINTAIDSSNKVAGAFVFHEVIKFVSRNLDVFSFGGSMMEQVENSYRRFGTVQTPYFLISKVMTKNPIIRFLINKKLSAN